jgi:Flp pilus assembly protein TadD
MIDENNHTATVRLGSAYFMLGDKENARLYYEKALKLNPEDRVTLEFMKKQGWR